MTFFRNHLRPLIVSCAVLALIVPSIVLLHSPPASAATGSPEESNVVIPPGPFIWPINITANTYEEISKKVHGFMQSLVSSGITALMNASQVFTQRIAADAAKFMLTGDWGGDPAFWDKPFEEYAADVGLQTGNQLISDLNEGLLDPLGLGLCTPIDKFTLSLSLGAPSQSTLSAKCTVEGIKAAFQQTKDSFESYKEVSDVIAVQFNGASEFDTALGLHQTLLDQKFEAQQAAILDRQENRGFKGVKDIISGNITSPNEVVLEAIKHGTVQGEFESLNAARDAIFNNAFDLGFQQVGILTAATFLDTLASGLMDKIMKGLASLGGGDDTGGGGGVDLVNSQAVTKRNVSAARVVLSDILTPNLISNDQQDFVIELSSCPTPRGLWSCAMDDAFAAAFRTEGDQGAYTVGQASHVVLNGENSMNPAFLHKDWELIPDSEVKDNTDSTCYQRAYCASNLTKLRYARILPVGWEMAANSPYNHKKNGKYITLEEVIRGFNVCNASGEADSAHPWCKLIDPNWVLAAPPFQCRVKGYGDTVFGGTGIRLQECADAVSCLKRDDHGKCTGGYGYCVAEKPVWRFSADECSERFTSCRTYRAPTGDQVSYLRNTIDYGSCSADNVGCLWYATLRNPKDISGTVWQDTGRIYFDKTVKTCTSANDGCTKLFSVKLGQPALNLVPNGSFELGPTEEEPTALSSWVVPPNSGTVNSNSSAEGVRSFELLTPPNTVPSPVIAIAPLRSYTLTVYARPAVTSTQAGFAAWLELHKADGSSVDPANLYRSAGCSSSGASEVGFDEVIEASDEGAWRAFVCTFVSNSDVATSIFFMNGFNIQIDAIQLEEGEVPTQYTEGVATDLAVVHLKLPPDELGCTGDEKTDNPLCQNFARMCAQTDAGCQGYRDRNSPGSPEIPATLNATDFCPASCVGYAEYLKQSSTFDLGRNADPRLDDPEDQAASVFIPSTANQCSIQDVGCEEFTNVQASAQGGEQKAHYNYIQACEQPGPSTETYFTWEGSDTTGYQLRTWSLIHDATQTPAPPKIIQKMGPDSILKDPVNCTENSWEQGLDADCRQVFNANGDAFYVYFSQTVESSASCADFRKNNSDAADCEKTGGTFTPTTGECVYHILASGSRTCSAAAAGCRAYLGAAGRNTTLVLEENFRTATGTLFTAGELSNEAILVGDQSLKLTGQAPLATATMFPSFPNQLYRVSFWAKTTSPAQQAATLRVNDVIVGSIPMNVDWKRYEFGPFPGSQTATSTAIEWINFPNPTFLDQIRIERLGDVTFVVKDTWQTPAECDRTPEGLPQPQAMLGCRAYTDRDGANVTVRQFGHLCRETAVGCKAFVDTRNTETPDVLTTLVTGTDTNTKVTPEAQAWEAQYVGDWSTTHPADRYVYAIDEPRARCNGAQASCRAFGKPRLNPDTLAPMMTLLTGDAAKAIAGPNVTSTPVSEYETVYLMDNVGQYFSSDNEPNMLCRKDELYCDAYTSGKTVAYFRSPLGHVCEWRDKVLLKADPANNIPTDAEYSGWFRVGQNVPCYSKLLSSGNSFLSQNAGDATYMGWVGACPVEQSECTEFRDPNDHSDLVHPSGKPYYFIHNQRLDVSSCSGQVDFLKGCVLFRDLSDPRLRFSVDATYAKSHTEGDVPQEPIDCVTDPSNAYCTSQKKCQNVTIKSCDGNGCKDPKLAAQFCVDDEQGDCQNPQTAQTPYCQQLFKYGGCTGVDTVENVTGALCKTDDDCTVEASDSYPQSFYRVTGTCGIQNDANIVMKVKLDRDCAEWLGCTTAETVFDPVQQKYTELCTELALCDQSKGASAGSFCGNYVDRRKEPVLKPGVFFDRETYTKRTTGFGQLDYSGYSIPDAFQAADLQTRLVGKELFRETPSLANTFAQDYRLVAAIPEITGLVEFPLFQDQNTSINPLYPDLRICTHTQTGRTGYFIPAQQGKRVCYLAVDALSTRSVDQGQSNTNPRNIEALSDVLRQSADPKNDLALQRSFPTTECKAYPESNAPFSNLYVSEWDFSKEPFSPKEIKPGYESATLCGYGEDCACSYRRVKYGGQVDQYVAPFGNPPPGGICNGGKKDGQTCIPGQQTIVGAAGTPAQAQSTTEDVGCPGGGRCLAITDVVLVRGQFGQCLQRDYSRSVANDPGRHPCLVWNPNPILSSTFDTAHYNPLAGYTPPVNAGEYYCLAGSKPPIESIWSAESYTVGNDPHGSMIPGNSTGGAGDGASPFFYLPGALSKFNYDQGYIAGQCHNADVCGAFEGGGLNKCNCHDGSGQGTYVSVTPDVDYKEFIRALNSGLLDYNNNPWLKACVENQSVDECVFGAYDSYRFVNLGKGIDGNKPWSGDDNESPQAVRCVTAMSDPDPDVKEGILPRASAPFMDNNRGRWIMTGRGLGKTYMEYFMPVKPVSVAKWLNPGATNFDAASLQSSMRERNFAQFQFFPVNDQYAAACSLPPEFSEASISVSDWGDVNQVSAASNQVFADISKNFDGQLDRSKDHILVDTSNKPVKMDCSGLNDGVTPDYGPSGCYYKYWETSYRLEGVETFQWVESDEGTSFFNRHTSFYNHERNCTKSGFAIRAMFELADAGQNAIPREDVSAEELSGPWNFVGFWVTACKAGDAWESSLYLSLRVKHADICNEIGQVISPYSRQSAVFADRVWAGGSFVIPRLGYNYATQYAPFGSALSTGIPGKEPLFQTNGPVENWSALRPPTFLGAGASYKNEDASPIFRWAHLTNIFARVYRVYDYQDSAISKGSFVCAGGLNKNKSCPNPPSGNANDPTWKAKVDEICGVKATCNVQDVSVAVKDLVHKCNGLSGVNAGLDCGSGFSLPSLDPVCHNAAMKNVGGSLVPQYSACEVRLAWKNQPACEIAGWYRNPNDGICYSEKTAWSQDAFGCVLGSVQQGATCGKPDTKSQDCPTEIKNIPCIIDDRGPMAGHCGGGYDHARCSDHAVSADTPNPPASSECVFTASQWWGARDTGKPDATDLETQDYVNHLQDELDFYSTYPDFQTAAPNWPGGSYNWNYVSAGTSLVRAFLPTPNSGPVMSSNMSDLKRFYPNYSIFLASAISYPFAGFSRFGGVAALDPNSTLYARYPSPHPVNDYNNGWIMARPGLCEGAYGAHMDPANTFGTSIDPPTNEAAQGEVYYTYGRTEISNYGLQSGVCKGGVYDGQSCYSSTSGYKASNASALWTNTPECWPTNWASAPAGSCKSVSKSDGTPSDGSPGTPDCLSTTGDPNSNDPDLDNNSCTRSAGYKPRTDLCSDPNSETCLVGYDLGNVQGSASYGALAPTDVTSGLHKPSFLGLTGADAAQERHIAFYAPRPPTIAAPDLTNACIAPGQCRIATVGAFTLENQASGALAFAGGKAQVTMRFYGWAAQEQTPLKAMYVDWGDGSVTKIDNARIKNKKPFCGGTRECEFIPGLTCQSDADCPAAGGKCADVGTCNQQPSKICYRDADCQAGNSKDKCNIRPLFGNSTDACEAGYFEFSHAYACDPLKMNNCEAGGQGDSKRCSRNPDIFCTTATDCGSGDTCEAGIAPSSIEGVTGGCYDSTKVACRFTPKVMLVDSWNWCTGECRAGSVQGGQPTDAVSSKVKHAYGGCWDGTETGKNTNKLNPVMALSENECSFAPGTSKNIRPWIVYPGSVQIGTFK